MGQLLSQCFKCHRLQYEQLDENLEFTIGADRSKLQAIADEDAELLKDPTIQQVLADDGENDPPIDEEELNKYIKDLDTQ